MQDKIKVGDRVTLKSGYMPMTVTKVWEGLDHQIMVDCSWASKGKVPHTKCYPEDALEIAHEGPLTPMKG